MEFRERVKETKKKHFIAHHVDTSKPICYGPDLPFPPATIPQDGDTWGNWKYHFRDLTLEYKREEKAGHGHWYEVDLERCETAAGMLDWIIQVSGKPFISRADIGNLVEALDDLLHPQQHICGMGSTLNSDGQIKELNVKTYLRKRAKA